MVLRLVETQTDRRTHSVDVPGIARPSGLRDIAALGLTLAEAKQLLARVQQVGTVYTVRALFGAAGLRRVDGVDAP